MPFQSVILLFIFFTWFNLSFLYNFSYFPSFYVLYFICYVHSFINFGFVFFILFYFILFYFVLLLICPFQYFHLLSHLFSLFILSPFFIFYPMFSYILYFPLCFVYFVINVYFSIPQVCVICLKASLSPLDLVSFFTEVLLGGLHLYILLPHLHSLAEEVFH